MQASDNTPSGLTKYTVTIVTGARINSGTNTRVFLTLIGENGESDEMQLESGVDRFKTGQTDTFAFEVADLGDIKQVRIRHDNTGHNPGWFLDRIAVRDGSTRIEYQFPCNRYLAVGHDDKQIDRVLDAVAFAPSASERPGHP